MSKEYLSELIFFQLSDELSLSSELLTSITFMTSVTSMISLNSPASLTSLTSFRLFWNLSIRKWCLRILSFLNFLTFLSVFWISAGGMDSRCILAFLCASNFFREVFLSTSKFWPGALIFSSESGTDVRFFSSRFWRGVILNSSIFRTGVSLGWLDLDSRSCPGNK